MFHTFITAFIWMIIGHLDMVLIKLLYIYNYKNYSGHAYEYIYWILWILGCTDNVRCIEDQILEMKVDFLFRLLSDYCNENK